MQTHKQAVGWKSGKGSLGELVEQTKWSGAALEGVVWIDAEVESLQNQLMPSDASGPRRGGRVEGHLSKHESWEKGSNYGVTCGQLSSSVSYRLHLLFFIFRVSIERLVFAEPRLDVGASTFLSENNRCPRKYRI